MSDNSKINWTDATWNPVLGCDRVSPGCDSCYAIAQANIRARNPHPKVAAAFAGLTGRAGGQLDWTGAVNLLPERLEQPLAWRKPRKVFVNSLADLFHESVPDEFIACVFTVMAKARQHTFQVLTKRHGRMRSLLSSPEFQVMCFAAAATRGWDLEGTPWPLPNVWLGVSAEDQHWAAIRAHALLATPAAVRWVSAEPLLGPVDLRNLQVRRNTFIDALCGDVKTADGEIYAACPGSVSWVVAGGESGPKARPMHPSWPRGLRDQCKDTGVSFWYKQWGAWAPGSSHPEGEDGPGDTFVNPDGETGHVWFNESLGYPTNYCGPWGDESVMVSRVGTGRAGRVLDGHEWSEFPRVPRAVTAS